MFVSSSLHEERSVRQQYQTQTQYALTVVNTGRPWCMSDRQRTRSELRGDRANRVKSRIARASCSRVMTGWMNSRLGIRRFEAGVDSSGGW